MIELKTGVTRDGRLTARQGRIYFDTGAFAGSGPGVASVATMVLAGPYRTPNLLLEGFAVYTNKTNCGSYRAPSGPQANFAVESQMDIIADALGIDPLELRLRNIVREGDEGPTGQVLTAVGLEECLRRAADGDRLERSPARARAAARASPAAGGRRPAARRASTSRSTPTAPSPLNTGAVEIGTAALTGAAQILAEELGVDLDRHQRGLRRHLRRRRSTSAPRAAAPPSRSATRASPPRPTCGAARSRWRPRSSARPRRRSRCATSTWSGPTDARLARRARAPVAAARAAG